MTSGGWSGGHDVPVPRTYRPRGTPNGAPAELEHVSDTILALEMRLYAPILCQGSSHPQLERVSAVISTACRHTTCHPADRQDLNNNNGR